MPETTGLFSSLRRLLTTLLGITATRIELLANELEEERMRVMRMLLFALLTVFCVCMGMVLLTLLIVAVFWQDHPLLTISVLALSFFLAAGVFGLLLTSLLKQRSVLFSASVAELRKDQYLLGGEDE